VLPSSELLIPYYDDFFETGYTARMEEKLDEVDKTFARDRDRALGKRVSGRAGIPLAQARSLLSFRRAG
jgi:hypothetical protein